MPTERKEPDMNARATFTESAGGNVMPRATIAEIVGHYDRAMREYETAFAAIEAAYNALTTAEESVRAAAPHGADAYVEPHIQEVAEFRQTIRMPKDRGLWLRTAQRLAGIRVWGSIIEHTDLERLMDAEAKKQLRDQMQYQPETRGKGQTIITKDEAARGLPPVTEENIRGTLEQFMADAEMIWRRGIANAFSKLDRRFKSHDGFKVGNRIILDRCFTDYGSWGNYSQRDTLLDIERVFSILNNGQPIRAVYASIVAAVDNDRASGWGARQSEVESEFFKVRIFKNGNAHLWFTRKDLVKKVNRILAEHYGETVGDGRTQEADPFENKKTTPAKAFGFFPTPAAVVETVVDRAKLLQPKGSPRLRILEPSAGPGNLARACFPTPPVENPATTRRERQEAEDFRFDPSVDVVEIQRHLAADLREAGIFNRVYNADFLLLTPDVLGLYDLIVMNPPFDRERDIDHVTHAMKFLKPDGQLIAIMSAGTEFRDTRKSTAFRAEIARLNGRMFDLPAGSFAEAGTWINTIYVKVNANGVPVERWHG